MIIIIIIVTRAGITNNFQIRFDLIQQSLDWPNSIFFFPIQFDSIQF